MIFGFGTLFDNLNFLNYFFVATEKDFKVKQPNAKIVRMFLKGIHSKYIFFLILILYVGPSFGTNLWSVNDSLTIRLNQTTDPEQRYVLLRHLADVNTTLSQSGSYVIFRQLYNEALKNDNEKVQTEALIELTNTSDLDSLNLYMTFAERLPDNANTRGLRTSIRVQKESSRLNFYTEKERVERIEQMLNMYKNMNKEAIDVYERVFILEALSMNYGHSMSKSERYISTLEELYELSLTLPSENYYFRGRAILRLAIVYSSLEEHEKAIDADKKLLEYIKWLEKRYADQGRIYRNYTTFYYSIYRRILSSYPALTAKEVNYYYGEVEKISHKTEYLSKAFKDDNRLHLYYYMAIKQYDKALVYIEKELEKSSNQVPRYTILRYYIEALQALDQKDKLLTAQQAYIEALQEQIYNQGVEKQNELQVLYDVENLNNENAQLELEKNELQIQASQRFFFLSAGIFALLILFIIFLLIFRVRDKKLTSSLKKEKKSLLDTQKELEAARDQALSSDRMKSVFIQNMSHEIRTPLNAIVGFSNVIASIENQNDDIKMFSKTIMKNSELLLKLVDDLLMLSDIETGKFRAYKKPSNINKACRIAVEQSKCLLEGPTKLSFSTTLPDNFMLETDVVKIEVLLKNLLSNAIKFTQEGTVNLTCNFDEQKQNIVFAVTNPGIKISKEQSETIFDRFVKLDEFAQGNGLGLFISRLVADLLGGRIYLDTTYEEETRFVFELPVK